MRSFSTPTLAKFEDAAASVPLRNLVRAFEAAGVAPGGDPGGAGGERRTRFRRYVAGADQREEPGLERLGRALGALIGEVAESKVDFLVSAAAADGFAFADGAFALAAVAAEPFDVVRREDVARIGERTARLRALVLTDPDAATGAARALLGALCRTVASAAGAPEHEGAGLADVVARALEAVGLAAAEHDDATVSDDPESRTPRREDGDVVSRCLGRLVAVVAEPGVPASRAYTRLAVGTAVTLIECIADAHVERARAAPTAR